VGHPTEFWDYSYIDTLSSHASDTGQKATAAIVWSDYRAVLQGKSPIPLTVRPRSDQLPAGKNQSFDYLTAPHARVSLKLTFTGGRYAASASADGAGGWHASWPSARHTGKVFVDACASKGGVSLCVDEYFIVG
jgi:hypothetical protein